MTRPIPPPVARQRGMTLVEIVIATAIVAMVLGLTWGSFHETFKVKESIEATSGRYHTVRVAMERLVREISMAYVSQNDDTTLPERRTFFVAKRKSDIDELRFSMFGHQRLYADADEADTSQVAYYGGKDRYTSRPVLLRRETRRLQNLKVEQAPGRTDVLCDDVVRLKFDYWDSIKMEWREEWSTIAIDGQPDRLPSKVKISLTVLDERGREMRFVTEVRIQMQEPVRGG